VKSNEDKLLIYNHSSRDCRNTVSVY